MCLSAENFLDVGTVYIHCLYVLNSTDVEVALNGDNSMSVEYSGSQTSEFPRILSRRAADGLQSWQNTNGAENLIHNHQDTCRRSLTSEFPAPDS